jgi:hypothetical protein
MALGIVNLRDTLKTVWPGDFNPGNTLKNTDAPTQACSLGDWRPWCYEYLHLLYSGGVLATEEVIHIHS